MEIAIWNVLHDGELIAAEGAVPGDLRLSVGIPYLCDHLPTHAAHLFVTLVGCDQFEYQPYQQPPVSEPSTVAAVGLELLSAEVANLAMRVECADGGVRRPARPAVCVGPCDHRRGPAAFTV